MPTDEARRAPPQDPGGMGGEDAKANDEAATIRPRDGGKDWVAKERWPRPEFAAGRDEEGQESEHARDGGPTSTRASRAPTRGAR